MLFGFPQHPGAVVGAGCAVARGYVAVAFPAHPTRFASVSGFSPGAKVCGVAAVMHFN
jgi:hypothetical protein